MNKALLIAAAGVVLIAAGLLTAVVGVKYYWDRGQRDQYAGGVAKSPVLLDDSWKGEDWLTEYTLIDRSGKTFDSHQLDGQVQVVSFFFASCPHNCTRQNSTVADVHREFGRQGVQFVSITCDPQNDTPEVLRDYARRFGADENWHFLTGDLDYIKRIGAEVYGLPVDKASHSEKLVVVDRRGEIRDRFTWNDPAEMAEMKSLLEKLLAEPARLSLNP